MAVSVDLQGNPNADGNPYIADVGKKDSDAVIIGSGHTSGTVTYEIRRQDRTPWTMNGTTTLRVLSTQGTSELVRAVSSSALTLVLPMRQWFEVRSQRGSGSWSNWLLFKTRDKTYALPDAITETRVTTAASATGQTVTVTNAGKARVATSSTGSRVVNYDNVSNEVTSITNTSRGQTVRVKTTERATATGVQITKN